jgi:hypothetical protein
VNELGDFVLQPSPVLVAGRVIDGNGAPVNRANIQLMVQRAHDPFRFGSQGPFWRELPVSRCRSDADGHFELRGHSNRVEFGMQTFAKGQRGGRVVARSCARDVVLQVFATGDIVGQLLLDPTVARQDLHLTAQRAPTDEQERPDEKAELSEDGRFSFRDLEPGAYSVALGTRSSRTPVVLFESVLVEGGQVASDRRLNPLDMRGLSHPISVAIVDAQGQLLEDSGVLVANEKSRATFRRLVRSGGHGNSIARGRS